MLPCLNCTAERLTATVMSVKPAWRQRIASRQASCRTQSPISTIRAGLLGDRDEASRRYQTEIRVIPANQGFRTEQLAARDFDLRLVMHHELPFCKAAAKT